MPVRKRRHHDDQSLLPLFASPRPLFLAKSASAQEWKAVAAAIKTLVEEATFEASTEGLSFRAMDPSHVALVDLTWPNSAWERFESEKPYKFSLRVEDLVKLIGRSETRDSVEISSSEEDNILIRFQNGYKREFTIHLIESSSGPAPLPKLEFDTKATLTKSIFERVLGDISAVADQVTIEAVKDKLSFSGKSDIGKASISLEKNDADVLGLEVKAETKATYSADYLINITKTAGSASDTLVMEYSSRKPIKLSFRLNDQGAALTFFLAPRVSSD
jgi:proliferating cell nuclear antigen